MDQKSVEAIEKKIGYIFRNEILLEQAFTRSSYAHEHDGVRDNEVLEFIGDEALDFIVAKNFIGSYSGRRKKDGYYDFALNQGRLTELKKECVDSVILSKCIDDLGFAQYLRMGNSDVVGHVERQQSVKEDLFEAILGAVTLDSNWDLQAIHTAATMMQTGKTAFAGNVFYRQDSLWEYNQKKNDYLIALEENRPAEELGKMKEEVDYLWNKTQDEAEQDYEDIVGASDPTDDSDSPIDLEPRPLDYVGMLQRYVQTLNCDLPNYSYTHKTENGILSFTCICTFSIAKDNVSFSFSAKNQKLARQGAAQKGYSYCRDFYANVIGADILEIEQGNAEDKAKKLLQEAAEDNAVSILNELGQIVVFVEPTYNFSVEKDQQGSLIWTCTCSLNEKDVFSAQASNKNTAKRKAAFLAIQKVPEIMANPVSRF